MKLLRFGSVGSERPGMLDAEGRIRDLSEFVSDIDGSILTASGLTALRALDPHTLPLVEGTPRLGSCISRPGKFICVGLNYSDHAEETKAAIPTEPVLFMKATSSVSGPNDPVRQPRGSTKLDWEVELALVIGTDCAYATEAEAEEAIAGYFVCHDVSERAFQMERGGTWDKGKGCDTFGPIGPWFVTADEVADVRNLRLWLEVNGRRFQDGNTSNMIFPPAVIVSYVSQFMSLQPGDVISTGTPAGVGLGQSPPVYLKPGDEIRLGIDGLGEQHQRVVASI